MLFQNLPPLIALVISFYGSHHWRTTYIIYICYHIRRNLSVDLSSKMRFSFIKVDYMQFVLNNVSIILM